VIAHRLSTVRSADQILVLQAGQIVERGDHASLMANGGRYRELYERQFRTDDDHFLNPGETAVPPTEPPLSPPSEPPSPLEPPLPLLGPLFRPGGGPRSL
jgi:hypothetical protein